MTASRDVPGFYLRDSALPRGRVIRAALVDVSDAGPQRFSQVIAESTGERVAFDRQVWNSQLVELGAIASTLGAPETNLQANGDIRYALRLASTEIPARGATVDAVTGGEGRPVIGAQLLVLRVGGLPGLEALNPSAEGISAEESLRRQWVLALYEEISRAGRRARLVPRSERTGGLNAWVVAGGVVVVGALVAAVVYGLERAEIERRQALELEVLRNGARAAEERVREWRRTGRMPAETEAERSARSILTDRANTGWERVSRAASDAIYLAGQGARGGLWLLGAGLAFAVIQSTGSRE